MTQRCHCSAITNHRDCVDVVVFDCCPITKQTQSLPGRYRRSVLSCSSVWSEGRRLHGAQVNLVNSCAIAPAPLLTGRVGRDRAMKYFTLKYLKFHGNFEIYQDTFFEIFHEIFNFHYKVT